METFGEIIKRMRIEKGLPLRTVAAALDIDQAILSKMERGLRSPSRELVVKMAAYFGLNEDELLVSWLSDKLVYEVADEHIGMKALQMAEAKVNYIAFSKIDRNELIKKIIHGFKGFNKVKKAWLFGSFAREDDDPSSDIDILIDVPQEISFTLFDIAEIQEQIQTLAKRKVDVVMLSAIRPEVKERIKNDMKLIYEAG
jgi:predicted nucleotidyltransferase/DNA-binding XRE family transcriptional regulator